MMNDTGHTGMALGDRENAKLHNNIIYIELVQQHLLSVSVDGLLAVGINFESFLVSVWCPTELFNGH